MFQSYLMFFKHEGLLASGSWPGAAEKDFGMFWASRFCVEVPRTLIDYLFPWLADLEQETADMGEAALPSHLSAPKVVAYLASVLVQDSLDLAERFPDNVVHKHLLCNDEFRCAVSLLFCDAFTVQPFTQLLLASGQHACPLTASIVLAMNQREITVAK